mgnify:CR=1 FL=1
MEELYAGLFRAMNRFGKLRIGDLFSDMTKSDGMMLWAISQLNQEKAEEESRCPNWRRSFIPRILRYQEH